jgi:hypothetical protein
VTRSQFQNPGIFGQFEESIKNPLEPAIRIRTETLMDDHPRLKIGWITILVRLEILLVGEF